MGGWHGYTKGVGESQVSHSIGSAIICTKCYCHNEISQICVIRQEDVVFISWLVVLVSF